LSKFGNCSTGADVSAFFVAWAIRAEE
jgi:hypothetical protein